MSQLDAVAADDERIVHERLAVIRDLLQAKRARIGLSGADSHTGVRTALGAFASNAQTFGWTRAFDELIQELRAAAAQPGHEDAGEFAKAAEYLAEVEPLIVRLARRTAQRLSATEQPRPRVRYLSASHKVPALHSSGKLVDAEAKRPFVEPIESAHLRTLCRDVLDELASLASLRVPHESDAWTLGAGFEERLLQMLDAAMALSRGAVRTDMVHAARKRAEASPIADPSRWFVPAFLLACTAENPAMDALREIILDAPRGVHRGLVDALSLGSNPLCLSIADSLFDEDDRPDLLTIALEVAARRGSQRPGDVLALLEHPNTHIAERAILAALRVVSRPKASAALSSLLDRDDLALQTARGLTLVAPSVGTNHLRERIRRYLQSDPNPATNERCFHASETLAALGQAQDEPLLVEMAKRMDSAVSVLGIHGLRSEMNWLLAQCLQDDIRPERQEFCVRALERITGLREEDDPSPGGQHRARSRYLDKVREFVPPKESERLRQGNPFHPSMLLDELSNSRTTQQVRRGLVAEAILWGAPSIDVDLEGWIALQEMWFQAARAKRWGWKMDELRASGP